MTIEISAVKHYLLQLQDDLSHKVSQEEGGQDLQEDRWQHSSGSGGGRTRVLSNGQIFEQAGIGFSEISGNSLPTAATQKRPDLAGCAFKAMGVSLVFHPRNPYVPTTHANLRFFWVRTQEKALWWFGGGYDLTPYYPFVEDCVHWHLTAKNTCDPFGQAIYPQFKKQCDDYFYLPHRQEARGIGGIFFDDLNQWGFSRTFSFIKQIGASFWLGYQPILDRRKAFEYGQRERNFQAYRRGRYVEFNLIYDRGTLFGLQSGGRTESILMSLPPMASWKYNWMPEPGTKEALLYTDFLPPRNWAETIL